MIRLNPQAILLPIDEYYKSLNLLEEGRNAGIETESGSFEKYFFLETILDKDLGFEHSSDYNQLVNVEFIYQITPQKVHYKLELWGIGTANEHNVFIFKPWAIGIKNEIQCKLLENFLLHIPATLFYNMICRFLFMGKLNINDFKNVRILKEIPLITFQNYGLDNDFVVGSIISKNIILSRIYKLATEKYEILDFYEKNWDGLPENLESKYFNPLYNVWFKVIPLEVDDDDNLDFDQEPIGYLRLYHHNQTFTGGFGIEYLIDKTYRNHGYAKQIATEIIGYLIENSYSLILTAEVDDENIYSKKVLEATGFESVKTNAIFGNYNYSISLIDDIKELERQDKANNVNYKFKNKYFEIFDRYY